MKILPTSRQRTIMDKLTKAIDYQPADEDDYESNQAEIRRLEAALPFHLRWVARERCETR